MKSLLARVPRGAKRAARRLRASRPSIVLPMLAAFVVVTLPLYIAGFALFRWGSAQVKAQIIGDAQRGCTSYLERVDGELSRIRSQQTKLLQDEDVMRLAVLGQGLGAIERVEQMNRAQDRLLALWDSSALIEDVSVHFRAAGYSLNARESYTRLEAGQYADLEALAASGPLPWPNGRPALMMTYPLAGAAGGSAYMAQVDLSAAELARLLQKLGFPAAILIDPAGGAVLACAGWDDTRIAPKDVALWSARGADAQALALPDGWLILARAQQSGLVLAAWASGESVSGPLGRYQPYFWLFTALAAALAASFVGVVYRLVRRPLAKLVGAFARVRAGDFCVTIEHTHNDEFKDLYQSFNAMVAQIKELIDHVYRERIYAQQMELKQLQSQINPHFLYNSFFALESMAAEGDNQSVSEFTRLLGRYFQYITREPGMEARLSQEVEHARNYALLQARRYRNRISLSFEELPARMADWRVPKLLVQPILENAFEHGLKNKLQGGLVLVRFAGEGDFLRLTVEDNGEELSDGDLAALRAALLDASGQSTGLVNVHRRLALRFGPDCGVDLARGGLGGLLVTLTIAGKEAA